ncbi:hypothetical protein KC19_9G040600 [Ceratodon purpureus]|uniref:Uncharacterized protein n=1 Tax=Ceratodon purpureus TaxID=3225 RepID=A0A8T0GTZ2_CERPU|nr:hypothetical protein KC19_9G040600 [Ceratodon purpureus]
MMLLRWKVEQGNSLGHGEEIASLLIGDDYFCWCLEASGNAIIGIQSSDTKSANLIDYLKLHPAIPDRQRQFQQPERARPPVPPA